MKKILIYLSLLTISVSLFGQSCLPGDNYFSTQADIDNFYINNPNCTTIEGDLMIMGDDITSLSGLQNITTFEGGLWIELCPLESFSGLENVTYIGDYLEISQLTLIENFDGLSNLTYVGGALDVLYLPELIDINGLASVISSPTHLMIWGNSALTNLDGLNSIQSVSTTLKLKNNTLLDDISAIESIDLSTLTSLTISGNPQLSSCHVNSICAALENGITNFTVENNNSGCNTTEEIENSCTQSIISITNSNSFTFYPNPAKTEISFNQHRIKNIKIFNQIGQLVYSQKGVKKTMDISILETGVYFLNIEYSNILYTEKLVVERKQNSY
jgi:hypothetical protein